MATSFEKRFSFGLLCVSIVGVCQFVSVLLFVLVLRAGYGI